MQRSLLQSYFIKNLKERPHGDIGTKGFAFLKHDLSRSGIAFKIFSNNRNHIDYASNTIVLNVEDNTFEDRLLLHVVKTMRDIVTTCEDTIGTALQKQSAKRGTVALDYGFTLNKCSIMQPKNAILDYDLPIHSSSVKNKHEIQEVLSKANELILMFEKRTTNKTKVFGVTDGKWFQEKENSFHSAYKNKIPDFFGIKTSNTDCRIFGVTVVFYSRQLKLHRDILNSKKSNFSMVVCFNHVIELSTLPPSSIIPSLKLFKDQFGCDYLNMSIICYGRQCVDALCNKQNTRLAAMKEDNLVDDFVQKILVDDSWEYESWLLTKVNSTCNTNIPVLCDSDKYVSVTSFIQSLNQNDDEQNHENSLFKATYYAKPSVLPKFLYWSSFAFTFYTVTIRMNLSIQQAFEVYLFMCLESNGQCLIAQVFYWHVLRMDKETFQLQITKHGSLYAFLTNIISYTINR